MPQIGIMIEGQDGLNWTRWTRLLQAAEDFGYQCLFRSDHYANANPPEKDSLELWVSLTYAASHTKRIEFGSMVAPVTFRHPAMTARMGAQVSDLSGGRLFLGLGAGWNEYEHRMFGVPFYDRATRFAMFTEALELTTRLLDSDTPVSFQGEHFSLENAILLPRPTHRPPILIGGNGPNKTLGLVAKYAQEWNGVFITPELYRERSTHLDELLRQQGREPGSVARSLMTQVVFGRDDAELNAKLDKWYGDRGQSRGSADDLHARGMIAGTPAQIVEQIGHYAEAGVQRFMLQWLDQDDIDGLEAMAKTVLPQVH